MKNFAVCVLRSLKAFPMQCLRFWKTAYSDVFVNKNEQSVNISLIIVENVEKI